MTAYRAGLGASRIRAKDWEGWVWPVPYASWDLQRPPEVSSKYSVSEYVDSKGHKHRQHGGVDILYRRRPGEKFHPDGLPTGSSDHSAFVMPPGQPAISAGPGKIWYAEFGKGGHHILIDHGNVGQAGPVTSYYQHLAKFYWDFKKGDPVYAGQPLGPIGDNPDSEGDPRHLHFELRFPIKARDPEPYLKLWRKIKLGERPP